MKKNTNKNLFAAIDIGSNNFQLHIAEVDKKNQQVNIIFTEKIIVQLALNLFPSLIISDDILKRAENALLLFKKRLAEHKISENNVSIIATQPLRIAKNKTQILDKFQSILNNNIHVISGEQEAQFIYQSIAKNITNANQLNTVIDIGGGSTEIIFIQNKHIVFSQSFNIGCLTYTQLFNDNILEAKQQILDIFNQNTNLQNYYKNNNTNLETIFVTSGSARRINNVLNKHFYYADSYNIIQHNDLNNLIDFLLKHPENLQEFKTKHQNIFIGSLAIFSAIFDFFDKHFNCQKMQYVKGELNEGIFNSLLNQ